MSQAHTSTDIYKAKVVDNQDPECRGRLRVECTALLGSDQAISDWVDPVFPYAGKGYGWFFVPETGASVELEVDSGSSSEEFGVATFMTNPNFKWISATYLLPTDVPTEFGIAAGPAYGRRMGLKTPQGLLFMLDDSLKQIVLKYGKLRIGSETAANPLVLGDLIQSILVTLFQAVKTAHDAHTHPYTDNIGDPPVPTPSTTSAPTAPMTLSLTALQGLSWLSSNAFTEKGTP